MRHRFRPFPFRHEGINFLGYLVCLFLGKCSCCLYLIEVDKLYGATEEPDGIDLVAGGFGPDYPDGLFVAQDGNNRPYAQNFKLGSWRGSNTRSRRS